MNSDAEAAYVRLSHGLDETRPPCRDDWRFLLDEHDLDPPDLAEMRHMCATCPLRPLCHAYATVAQPPAGMWAGSYYPARRPRKGVKGTA